MTNYEKYFGTPEDVVETLSRQMGECLMGHIGYGCDKEAFNPCPFLHCDCDAAQIAWLKEEAHD